MREANQKYKQTILMITHNPELAKQAERVLTIEDGRVGAGRSRAAVGANPVSGNAGGGAGR